MSRHLPRYRSPEAASGAQANALRRLVSDFIQQAAGNPDYNTANVVHDCVVYVVKNKPPEIGRVDGTVIQPIIHEVVSGLLIQSSPRSPSSSAPKRSWLARAASALVSAARQLVH